MNHYVELRKRTLKFVALKIKVLDTCIKSAILAKNEIKEVEWIGERTAYKEMKLYLENPKLREALEKGK